MSQPKLLTTRHFAPRFLTQQLDAFNANLFKNALIAGIAFGGLGGAAQSAGEAATWVNLSAGLFILPFFLFSATAGQLADKAEKSTLIRSLKLAEVAGMALAAAGLYTQHATVLMVTLIRSYCASPLTTKTS